MKHLFTLATTIVLCASLQAQVTIGQNEMPHSGDDLNRTRATLNPFVNYGATGAGHTWNFASLTAAGEEGTQYLSVSSTNLVYAFVYADIIFNPNRANHANSGTDIAFSDLLPIGDAYTFRHQSATAYTTVGYGAEVSNLPVPIIFDEHDVVYELPLNYGNSSVSTSSWKINLPSLAYYGYRQTRQNQVDGWGTITTPSGIFDALRVKTTITAKDTINLDTLGLGFAINRPTTREYKWLAQDIRVPVLQINTVELLGAEVVTAIYFYDQPHTINVQQPLAAMLCTGSSVSVPFESTGTYNSGSLFVAANVFRAQLSDANGAFTSPVNIGSITSTTSGSINATIPANTPLGTGYRIRVISTSPAFTGADNGVDLTVGTTPVAMASADGPTHFCAGTTVELLAGTDPGSTYQWMNDGVAIDQANAATWEVGASGSYAVQVTNACGSALSTAIDVVVAALPVHLPDTSQLVACNGDAVVLSATNTSGQTVLAYQWMLNGETVDSAITSDLTTSDAGAYTLEVTNISTGCSFTTASITVIAETVASPALTAAGPIAFCEGGAVQLNADAQGSTLAWFLDGITILEADGQSLAADSSGAYSVVATSALGCVSGPSNVILVDVLAVPGPPEITASGDISFCEGGTVNLIAGSDEAVSFQWNTGGTVQQLAVTTGGSYSVVAIAINGCTSTSSEAVDVVVFELPEIPVITALGGELHATGTGAFQWSYNGEEIPGADQSEWTPDATGTYTVTVTNGNGCSSTSEAYAFMNTAVVQYAVAQASVWPNPTTGHFIITWPDAQPGTRFSVFDVTGAQVQTGSLSGVRTSVELGSSTPGLYLLRVEGPGGNSVVRIVLH